MKILIYGAGVLGGNLAHYLKKQHDITLLVRESSLQKYIDEGIVIKPKIAITSCTLLLHTTPVV